MFSCAATCRTSTASVRLPTIRDNHRKLHEIPFNSKNKWKVWAHALPRELARAGE